MNPKRRARLDADPHCHYCRIPLDDQNSSLDHVVPKACGGQYCDRNLVLCCHRCQRIKWDIPLEYMVVRHYSQGGMVRVWNVKGGQGTK